MRSLAVNYPLYAALYASHACHHSSYVSPDASTAVRCALIAADAYSGLAHGAPRQTSSLYKTGIDVAGFAVTVLNRSGEPVPTSRPRISTVREDGVAADGDLLQRRRGRTMRCHFTSACCSTPARAWSATCRFSRNAAIRFLNTFPKAIDFTFVEFADDVRAARFTQAEFPRLVERIRGSKAKGRTALYDAAQRVSGQRVRPDRQESARPLHRRRRYVELADVGSRRCVCCARPTSPCIRSAFSRAAARRG